MGVPKLSKNALNISERTPLQANPPVFCFFVAPTHSDINNLHCNAKMQQSWGEYLVSLQQFDGYMFVLKTHQQIYFSDYFFYHVKIMLFSLCSQDADQFKIYNLQAKPVTAK